MDSFFPKDIRANYKVYIIVFLPLIIAVINSDITPNYV